MTLIHRRISVAILPALLAATAPAALAQGATISGMVRSNRGDTLRGSQVRIPELNVSVATDARGIYRISIDGDRARGQAVTLAVRAIGYRPQNRTITVTSAAHDYDFALQADTTRSSELVSSRRDTLRTPGTATKPLAFTVDKNSTVDMPPSAVPFAQYLFPPELVMQHQAKLKITEAQRNFIIGEITRLQTTAVQVQWRVGDESEKLSQVLQRETIDEAEALAQVDRVMNHETAVKRAQLVMLIRIRNMLTPEQRQYLQQIRQHRE